MMDLLYDVPKEYFRYGIPFLKELKKGSRVIIYGKGVYASNLIAVIERYNLCHIVKNIDSGDSNLLFEMSNSEYDYVVIAILDYMLVNKVKKFLIDNRVQESKIITIQNKDLNETNLPKNLFIS